MFVKAVFFKSVFFKSGTALLSFPFYLNRPALFKGRFFIGLLISRILFNKADFFKIDFSTCDGMCSNNQSPIQDLRCQVFLWPVNKYSAIVLHYFAQVRLWHFEFIACRFQLYANANLYPDELFALLFTPVASRQKWQRWIMLPVFNNKIPVFPDEQHHSIRSPAGSRFGETG